MTVLHLFDSPLTVTRPYEAYFGSLTVPRKVALTAAKNSVILDWATPRKRLLELIEETYPGIRREHVHVWTLSGKSRVTRIGALWAQWRALGVHLVEDGWKAPSGLPVFTDSGTYAPSFLVKSWKDETGATHVFLCDGYAATAEAMQAGSLSEVLDLDSTMTVLSPTFHLSYEKDYELMKLAPDAPDFEKRLQDLVGTGAFTPELVARTKAAIRDAEQSNIPLAHRVLRPDDFLPEKTWRVLACDGYICDDPYTGTRGVEDLGGGRYRVTTRLATHKASSRHPLHLPPQGQPRRDAPGLQPAPGALHVRRRLEDARGEGLGLGPHPQRAADADLSGARVRRRLHSRALGSRRREGVAEGEAGAHPPGARVVQGEPPRVVRVAEDDLSRPAR